MVGSGSACDERAITSHEGIQLPYIQGALLCHAAADYGGKVSVLGGFIGGIYTAQFPMPAPIHFAGRMAFDDEEVREAHDLCPGEERGERAARRDWCPHTATGSERVPTSRPDGWGKHCGGPAVSDHRGWNVLRGNA